MQYAFINHLDTAFDIATVVRNAFFATDRFTRDALSILCWGVGRTVNALTSRRAFRVYAHVIRAIVCTIAFFTYACQCAYESGKIVGAGYYGIEEPIEAEVLALPASPVIGLLPPAAEPITEVLYFPLPVLVTPVVTISGLLPAAISAATVTVDLNELTPQELRKRCQQAGIKWRNAKGRNKHLSKYDMVTLLAGLPEELPASAA
jgi:hypothetical protein